MMKVIELENHFIAITGVPYPIEKYGVIDRGYKFIIINDEEVKIPVRSNTGIEILGAMRDLPMHIFNQITRKDVLAIKLVAEKNALNTLIIKVLTKNGKESKNNRGFRISG